MKRLGIRYAARRLRRSPVASLIGVALIALGIASSTTVFSFVDALLLRPLPVDEPERLVQLFQVRPGIGGRANTFTPEFRDSIAEQSTTLLDVSGGFEMGVPMEDGGSTVTAYVAAVTPNYFALLGVPAVLGRTLDATDSRVAVVSHSAWIRYFGRDPSVIGRVVRLGGFAYEVVGVAPEGFNGTTLDTAPDFHVPYGDLGDFWRPELRGLTRLTSIIGRLSPGVSREQAQGEIDSLWSAYREETRALQGGAVQSAFDVDVSTEVRSISRGTSDVREEFSIASWLLFAGSTVLMLMVCLSVGGLMLSRVFADERETAVRLAVGANRGQIARQWIVESLILATAGGSLGFVLAIAFNPLLASWLSSRAFVGFTGLGRPLALEVLIDWRTAGMGFVFTAATGLLAGVAPAFQSARGDLQTVLKPALGESRGPRVQGLLAALQIALSMILIVGAGLMTRTLWNLHTVDAGFERADIVRFAMDPLVAGYDSVRTHGFQQQLLERTRELPEVESAGLARVALMQGMGMVTVAVLPGEAADTEWNTNINQATPEYFDTMGIRLVSGAMFGAEEWTSDPPAPVVVNEAFARRFFEGDAIGRVFDMGGAEYVAPRFQVAGVVSDASYRSIREEDPPIFYWNSFGPDARPQGFSLYVRTRSPGAAIEPVRAIVRSLDPDLPVEAITMPDEIARSLWRERVVGTLALVFAAFAVAVAGLGLYGILAQFVSSRSRELGLRRALGADAPGLAWLVIRHAAVVVALGVVAGTAAHLAVGRWLGSLIYQVRVTDPAAIAVAIAVIAVVAAAAGAVPLVRALSVDPAVTLREE